MKYLKPICITVIALVGYIQLYFLCDNIFTFILPIVFSLLCGLFKLHELKNKNFILLFLLTFILLSLYVEEQLFFIIYVLLIISMFAINSWTSVNKE